jgi:DMSO reductase family type II enzyme chaperone
MSAVTAVANESLGWEAIDLYRFFAFALASPAQEQFRWFSRPEAPQMLRELWQTFACEGEFPEFRWFANFQEYEATYIALFDAGVPEPPVPLFESAHDKTRPPQELVLENTFFYDLLGLRTDASRSVPDYLLTQLEFLAALRYARDQATDPASSAGLARAEREFLERHLLNWLPAAVCKLAKLGAPAFPVLLTLLAGFLRTRLQNAKDALSPDAYGTSS